MIDGPDARGGAPVRTPARLLGLAAVLFAGYGWFVAAHMGAVPGGADSSGYFNQARVLARFEVEAPVRELPGLSLAEAPSDYLYVPLGTRPAQDKEALVMTYPIGLPLLIAGASQLVGWKHAGGLVLWLHAMGGLVLLGLWLRACGLSRPVALAGTALGAASALYINMELQAMSDVPSMAWVTAAVLAAWQARKKSSWALAAGVLFAGAVLIRPSNSVALLPLAIALGFSWRSWLLFGLGGFPGAIVLGLYNLAAYGDWLATGYGGVGGMFQWQVVPRTLLAYLEWLPVVFSPLILLVILLPCGGRRRDPRTWANLSWVGAFLAFFVSYWHTHETWWYLRFVLPMMPALLAGSLVVLETSAGRFLLANFARATVLTVCLGALLWQAWWVRRFHAYESGYGERIYEEMVDWATTHLPPEAVICAMQGSGALYFSTPFTIVRWDVVPAERRAPVVRALAASGRPVFAILWRFEHPDALERLGGQWEQVGLVRDVTVWRQTQPAAAGARAG